VVKIPFEPEDQLSDPDHPGAAADPALAGMIRATMSGSVAERLVTAIAVGTYSPGERLPPERELATRLGVSRATLRQALQRVAELGLVESRRGRGGGTFVTAVAWHEVAPEEARRTLEVELPRLRELFDYRCMVEGMIARAAAQRRTPEAIEQLQAALAEFREAGTDMAQARALDRRLHGLVCSAAQNQHLVALSAHLTTAATLGFGAEPYEPDFFVRALQEHEELIEAVVAGEAERAQEVATAHFALTYVTMEHSLRRAVEV
jgi:GntR family transcriptional repressor for pyruvate dehydrogenase complex